MAIPNKTKETGDLPGNCAGIYPKSEKSKVKTFGLIGEISVSTAITIVKWCGREESNFHCLAPTGF